MEDNLLISPLSPFENILIIMHKYSIFFITICSLLLFSCKNKSKDLYYGEADHVLSIVPSQDTLVLSNCFNELRVINLKGCVVSKIHSAVIIDHQLLLSGTFYLGNKSKRTECEIALFSEEGTFLSPIAIKGRSANEVLNVQAMKFNPYKHTLDVLSDYGRCLLSYDTVSWTIKSKVDLSTSEILVAADFAPVNETQYLFYKNLSYSDNEEYKLYLYDCQSSDVLEHFFVLDKERAETISFNQSNNLSCSSNRVLFYESFMNSIYEYDGGVIKPYISFAENNYLMSEATLNTRYKDLMDFLEMCKASGKIWGHLNFYYIGQRIFSMFEYDNGLYYNVMNLDDDTSHSYRYVYDDMLSGITFSFKDNVVHFIGVDGKSLIVALDKYKYHMIKYGVEYLDDASDDELNAAILILS